MVSAGVDDAEVVACRGDVKVDLVDHGSGGICKVDANDAANRACNLVHESAGLAEELVLGVLRELCNFNVVNLAVVVKMAKDVSDHILERRRGGDARSLEDVGGGVGVKAANRKILGAEACGNARNESVGAIEALGARLGEVVEIHYVLGEALTLDAHGHIGARCGNRDDIEIDGGCDDATEVVVGVISGELTAARNRVESGVAIRAVKGCEFVDRLCVARFLCLKCRLSVDVGQLFVKGSVQECFFQFNGFHGKSPSL